MNRPTGIQRVPFPGHNPAQGLLLGELLLGDRDLAWFRSTQRFDGTWELEGSPAYTALTGFSGAQPPQHPLGVSLASHAPPEQSRQLAEALTADTVTTLTVEVLRTDGTPFTARVVVTPVAHAAVPTWLTLHHDLGHPDERAGGTGDRTSSRPLHRTARLIEHFDALADAKTIAELCSIAVGALAPRVGAWAGILRHPAGHPAEAELIACTTVPPGSAWPEHAVEAVRTRGSQMTSDGELMTVTVTAGDSVTWTTALARSSSRELDPAALRILRIQLARVGVLAEHLGRADHELRQIRTIESAVLAPPGPIPGLDIAAETVPPIAADSQSSWCDAFPIAGGTGLVVSHVYDSDADALTWTAVARPVVRALLWRLLDPRSALLKFVSFTFENISKIPVSAGQLVTLMPDGENFALRMASAVYLPFILRIPGEGFRIAGGEPNDSFLAGGDIVPMACAHLTIPPGTVIAMLTPSLFDGSPTVLTHGPDRLIAAWRSLPEDAPAAAYTQIAMSFAPKKFLTSRCVLVVRIPARTELT